MEEPVFSVRAMRPSDFLSVFEGSWANVLVNLIPALFTIVLVTLGRACGRTIMTWGWKSLRKNPVPTISLVIFLIVALRIIYDESEVAMGERTRAESRDALCARLRADPDADMGDFCNEAKFISRSFLITRILRNAVVRFEMLLLSAWDTANWIVRGIFLAYVGLLVLSIFVPCRQQAIRIDMDSFQQQRYAITQQMYEQYPPPPHQIAPPSQPSSTTWAGLPPPMQQRPGPRVQSVDAD